MMRGELRLQLAGGGLADQCSVQKVHRQTAEAQILVSADGVADVSVRSVALFVSESINRHGKELHAILEIIVDVWTAACRWWLSGSVLGPKGASPDC